MTSINNLACFLVLIPVFADATNEETSNYRYVHLKNARAFFLLKIEFSIKVF